MARWPGTDGSEAQLLSPWPLARCLAALEESMDRTLLARGGQPVIGRLSGTTLKARKRISYKNSFQTSLRAELSEEGGGTRIRCRFGMHPFVTVFMAVWLGGVLTIGGGLAVATLPGLLAAPLSSPPEAWMGVAIPLGMAVFGVALVWFGRFIARDERRFLLDFLRRTLHAAPAG